MEKYKTEFNLKVVNSFLAGEGGAKLLARQWSVPEEKIRTWVSHYRLHGLKAEGQVLQCHKVQFTHVSFCPKCAHPRAPTTKVCIARVVAT